jgi:ParB family chromosome partitioning protein
MQTIGLKTPITVRYVELAPEDYGPDGKVDKMVVVTGAHRLAAAKQLGWEKIECFVVSDCDEVDAELWEIAENLHRAILTALERDEQVARWIELQEQKRISAQSEQKIGRGRPKGGVSTAAREIGVEKEDARRAVKVAALSPEAKEVAREVGLDDTRTALLEAKAKGGGDAAGEVAYLRAEAERREAERLRKEAEKHTRDQDRVIVLTEAERFAVWLSERTDPGEIPTLISWLEGTKPREVIAALGRG